MERTICFDDVLLQPQYSDIKSREEISLDTELGKEINLKVPIISAPMDTVTEEVMASSIGKLGGLGIVHRYNTVPMQCRAVEKCEQGVTVGAAVGVKGDYIERAQELVGAGAKVICIDIAHGDHVLMRNALDKLTAELPAWVHIMAGNVATAGGFKRLADWGADSVKVGIGGGSICSTRVHTGHGIPTLQSVFDCAEVADQMNVKMIADGGIKNSGDIVKALGAGADSVMLGSLLAGTAESPGFVASVPGGERKKIYRGMASKEAQQNWKGSTSSLEGISTYVKYKGSLRDVMGELRVGIRSGFSYSGAKNLKEFQMYAKFLQQTVASERESSTHILDRH